MELLVVGAGEMGRWIARASGADTVAFADRDPEVAREAAAAVDGARVVPLDGDDRFTAVCIAVPMGAVPAAVAANADRATEAVFDVSGEMHDSVAALREHAGGRERASLHPLFSAANAPGNVPVIVDRDGPVLRELRATLEAAGNEVFETTPAEHDRAAPLAELVAEVAGNTPAVYADIQERFDGAEAVAEAAAALSAADRERYLELYDEADR
ncbi:prephenate dehydrogenase [Halobacteriales archaeon QS_8_69_73]|nr:MAG: prephenate dehydrogenase [Halobacteriales archaeon QS_8_69_73]